MLNKRSLLRTTLAVAAAATLGFAAQAQEKTIKIGVTAGPHAQIMEVVADSNPKCNTHGFNE